MQNAKLSPFSLPIFQHKMKIFLFTREKWADQNEHDPKISQTFTKDPGKWADQNEHDPKIY